MRTCVICHRELSGGVFSSKDKFELTGGGFICRECAAKIGIKNIWSASTYNAEKARKKYFSLYPEAHTLQKTEADIDKDYLMDLISSGRKAEALQYVKSISPMGIDPAAYIYEIESGLKKEQKALDAAADEDFIAKVKSIPNSDTTWTTKEIKYLRTLLNDGEEVLDVVSGIMKQSDVNVSYNTRETSTSSGNTNRTWLMALTDKRIILINRHLLIGTEHIEIPLSAVNSISCQSKLLLSSISIMHGSGGIIVNNIAKGCEKPFVDRANTAIEKSRMQSAATIVTAINSAQLADRSTGSVADELIKLKGLLDQGILTQEEFDAEKKRLLHR